LNFKPDQRSKRDHFSLDPHRGLAASIQKVKKGIKYLIYFL